MATKIKKINKNVRVITIFAVIVIVIFFIILLNQKLLDTNQNVSQSIIPSVTLSQSITSYQSKFLKISFSVPTSFNIRELYNDIILTNNMGKINISRNGTNNDTIEGYVFGLSDRGNLQVTNKVKFKIDGIDVISCNIKSLVSDEPESKAYYFYPAPWTVFSFSTDSLELFDDLDQIAQSFRYEH